MAYSPNASDATQPTTAQLAGNMAYELQAIKGRINSLVSNGTNFYNMGTYRNRLKNGAFNIQQRSNSFTITSGTGAYTADQWIVTAVSGGNVAVSITTTASTQIANMVISPLAGNTLTKFEQRIESFECQDLAAGTQVTISGFYAVNSLVSSLPTCQLTTPNTLDNYGGGVSVVGAGQIITLQQPQISGVYQYFTNTFTLSAAATKGMQVLFTWTNMATFTMQFQYLQLEKGSVASPYEFRPTAVEMAICQRYYYTGQVVAQGYGLTGSGIGFTYSMPVTPRAAPTVTTTTSSNTNLNTYSTTVVAGLNNIWFNGVVTSTGSWGFNDIFNASAEL